MTPELTALAALVALQALFGLSVSGLVSTRTGLGYIFGSREEAVDLETGLVGRMHRARINTFEALTYFTPTVLIVYLADAANSLTAAAAWTFVAARVVFVLCYALDLSPWRSIVWFVGLGAILTMLGAALL
ncbi:MAG: MAPEG family protein [Pseudomonadota bacterium]